MTLSARQPAAIASSTCAYGLPRSCSESRSSSIAGAVLGQQRRAMPGRRERGEREHHRQVVGQLGASIGRPAAR